MESPNLKYINQLAAGDAAVKEELIHIIKTEFPEEKKEYCKSIESGDFSRIAEIIHRVKHKISILGLIEGYEIANVFEYNLRNSDLKGKAAFEKVLMAITAYIKTI
ncbi:hypothetical protein PI23P_11537 [Polaribacter irgensii 23-P]|uniref:HPt domain-containing protein n=1 Tax=Polaribacter irgensii 23-P TaxID=313594 RepID=A4C1G0_9FLAO|nr:hypothetical protein [Polaribacter irgensii]EAR11963.1 hypothetical protein PI23P_11537 [Polaribacter irgensii 23-P]